MCNRARLCLLLLLCTPFASCRVDADTDGSDAPVALNDVLEADLTIGGIDERPEYEFGRIGGMAATRDGGVAVTDYVNNVVRVYDENGTHRFSFGREGAGPGEVSGPCCPAFDDQGRLWIRDGGNARYNIYALFADSAHYLSQTRMAHGDVNRFAPLTFDEIGHVIDIGSRHDAQGNLAAVRFHLDTASNVVREVAIHRVPDDSTAVKKVQRQISDGVAIMYTYQPYGPIELQAHAPGGEFAHALSSRYEIDWRDPLGQIIRHISGPMQQGPALSEHERGAAEERLQNDSKRLNVSRAQPGFDIPTHKPPLRALFFDNQRRLWVELAVADGADRTAHVYDRQGTLERTVSWPARVSIANGAIHNDVAWGLATDSLDVATVVRLRGFSRRR
jgi:hypothetical protein